MEIEQIDDVLEALLFVSGDELKISDLCEQLELQKSEITASIKRLQKRFGGKTGIRLISYNGKIQFASNPDYAEFIAGVLNPIKEKALSTPAMETLSIIAYRQPVTRLEIEGIRGVNCDYALQALLRNNLIEVVGRKEAIGKPLMFGTTEEFLKRFGIEDITQLPDRDTLLDRIQELEEGVSDLSDEQLYNFSNTEQTPEFLQGEEVVSIDGEEDTNGVGEIVETNGFEQNTGEN